MVATVSRQVAQAAQQDPRWRMRIVKRQRDALIAAEMCLSLKRLRFARWLYQQGKIGI